MRIDLELPKAAPSSVAFGAGFVALDVIQGENGDHVAAGGTCGNVMAILAWLGWTSVPVARLGADAAARFVVEDLQHAGVKTAHLQQDKTSATPIVIQRTVVDRHGERSHRFTMTCPECGQWLPRFRPFVREEANSVIEATRENPSVFFFDRVSPGISTLMRWAREKGALIVFEPSSYSDDKHFRDAVEACHILKFSQERLGHVRDFADSPHPAIVIETLGSEGLRLRWKGKWSAFNSFTAPRFIDAAGAGDWCTAGFVHVVGQSGAAGLKDLRKPTLEKAIRLGQALSAINCGYEGARGAMETLTRDRAAKVLRLLTGGEGALPDGDASRSTDQARAIICDICKPVAKKSPAKKAKRGG